MTVAAPRVSARELALSVVRDVFGPEQRGAQASFDVHARRTDLDQRDRAFAAELAYGAIKARRLIDWYLAPYLAARDKALPEVIAEILRLGVYQLRMMRGVDEHAAVFETVNLALHHGHKGTAGLVNAVLRRLIADAPPAPRAADFKNENDYLATAYSTPTWVATQWSRRFGERIEAILSGVNAAPQRVLRVNRLRASIEQAQAALTASGVSARASQFVEECLILDEGNAGDDPAGRWALQSEAAGMPVDLLAPRAGESTIEYCAGRGNKSVQIAARMGNAGTLYCVEIDARKTGALGEALERAGVTCAAVVQGDARQVDVPIVDAVLLDAPCSALGIIGRHPEARWRKTPEDGARLATLQGELLATAATRVKPGGRLVYSVCSTDPREGSDLIEAFLAERDDFARAPLPERYAEFQRDGDVLVPPGIDGRDGFYVASLLRAP
jgi:16S rRNA (cytosine967-C5)-methyltransferase